MLRIRDFCLCVLLILGSVTAYGQQFNLSDGLRKSTASFSGGNLIVVQGRERFTYERVRRLDSADGKFHGYYCRAADVYLQWPVSNTGNLKVRKNGVWIQARMRVSQVANSGTTKTTPKTTPGTKTLPVGSTAKRKSFIGTWSSVETDGSKTNLTLNISGDYVWQKLDEFNDPVKLEKGKWVSTPSKTDSRQFSFAIKTTDGFKSRFTGKWNDGLTKFRLTGTDGKRLTFTRIGGAAGTIGATGPAVVYKPGDIVDTKFGKAKVEVRTRTVEVKKTRKETRTRNVPRKRTDGTTVMVVETYEVEVPYTTQVQQQYQVLVPVSGGKAVELTPGIIIARPRRMFRRTVKEFVPNPALAEVTIKINNSHSDEIVLMVAEHLPRGVNRNPNSKQINVGAGKTVDLVVKRDSGGFIIVKDRDTGELISKTAVAPKPLYDIATYEMKVQSISIDIDGNRKVRKGLKSLGVHTLPAGERLRDGVTIDMYTAAKNENNTGAVSRYPRPKVKSTGK